MLEKPPSPTCAEPWPLPGALTCCMLCPRLTHSSRHTRSEQTCRRWANICTDVSALLKASASKQRSACASEPHIPENQTRFESERGSRAEAVVSKRIASDADITSAIVFADGTPRSSLPRCRSHLSVRPSPRNGSWSTLVGMSTHVVVPLHVCHVVLELAREPGPHARQRRGIRRRKLVV